MATTSDWGASREPFPRHLLYDARTIAKSCSRDFELGITSDDIFLVKRFFATRMAVLGRRLYLRQRCISTAVVYFRRFYLRHSFRDHDPRTMCAAALFLASKVEENPVPSQHVCNCGSSKEITGEPTPPVFKEPFTLTEAALVKAELVLVEGLQGHLLLEHPHSTVEPLVASLAASLKLDPAAKHRLAVAALSVANDSLRTDAALLFPPLAIAGACVLVAATLQLGESDGVQWAEEVLGGPEGAAASLAACPVLLAEYREFSGRSEAEIDEIVLEVLGVVFSGSASSSAGAVGATSGTAASA